MKEIVLIDLFSGIGGFHKGLEDAGFVFSKTYFSEIDKHAIAVYKQRFPNAEHIGSVKDVSGRSIRKLHPDAIIIVTFGWPCQDNSIAGKRKGQRTGTRSGLLFEAGRIVREAKAQHFLAENVKGLYSVNKGTDFYEAIRFLTFFNTDRPQYTLEMQLFNTDWFLPQNRERTYFVGHLGEGGGKRIFPFTENDRFFQSAYAEDAGEGQWFQVRSDRTASTLTSRMHKMGLDDNYVKVVGRVNSSQDGVVLDAEGNSQTLSAGHCNVPKIKVPSGNNAGYEEAAVGDSINYGFPKSKTRRGIVGKGVAQTLDTLSKQAVIQLNPSKESGGKQPYQQNRIYDKNGISPTIDQGAGRWSTNTDFGIRRLTEIECERLQGFPDNWTQFGDYKGRIKKVSRTQRYKMVGNAVSTDVVRAIGKKLINLL